MEFRASSDVKVVVNVVQIIAESLALRACHDAIITYYEILFGAFI